jgi:Ca2+:H+ antiporter
MVTPLICLIGWIMGKPMSLDFHVFETVCLFMSIIIVNYLIQDGKSNWLEGCMLLASYLIIAVAFFFY